MEEIETLESWVSRVCECDQENAEKVKATFMRFCITSGVPEDKLEELKKAVKDSDETEVLRIVTTYTVYKINSDMTMLRDALNELVLK